MALNRFELSMIIAMSIAIIAMSFTFPAMGLTGEEVDEGDIPDFAISTDRFEFTSEFPDTPGTPGEFTLQYNNTSVSGSNNFIWLDGDTDDGTEVVLLESPPGEGNQRLRINDWSGGSETNTTWVFTELHEQNYIEFAGYELLFEVTAFENESTHRYYEIEGIVRDTPTGGGILGGLGSIPVIGGLISAGESVVSGIIWVGQVLFWGVGYIAVIILNLLGILVDVVTYLVDMMVWLSTTYVAIVSGATDWAQVFAAIPGTIIAVIFAKVVYAFIRALPST